jgi:hypothetical protein
MSDALARPLRDLCPAGRGPRPPSATGLVRGERGAA